MNIRTLIKKTNSYLRILRGLPWSIWFNFHYLPFNQAKHIPILLYKPRLLETKGEVIIDSSSKVRFGMVRLGFPTVSIYPNSGVMYENHGGSITFKGRCRMGNNTSISLGSKGVVEIGDNFLSTTSLKLVSYDRIHIGDRVRFGWDQLVMDTDFHKLTKVNGGYSRGHAPIWIGDNNWLGNGCKVMKRTRTPDYCIFSAGTILAGPVDVPPYSIVGTKNEVVVKASGLWRNVDDDVIEY